MIRLLSFLLLIFSATIYAQQQEVQGALSAIKTDGLHKIKIPNGIRSYAKQDIRDFRIWNSKGDQVPYFVHSDDNETRVSNFSDFEIISKSNIPDTSATYIFENPKEKIEKAVVSIANYQGSKYFSLEGSNDKQQWFGLVNRQQLYRLNSQTNTSVYKVINFPLCSYRYLKIVFDNRNSLPINVLKIGTATTEVIESTQDEIAALNTNISELKAEKKTQIHISFEHPEIINQILFDITAPELYNRKASVYILKTREIKHKEETYRQQIASFTLRSDTNLKFPINSFFGKEVYIEIENQDNPKLSISSIKFLQKPLFVISDLKKGQAYKVSAGDASLTAPSYDISYFKNRISNNLAKAQITSVSIKQPDVIEKAPISFWQQSWFMWICIGFAGIIVVYFATSLLKDLKKEEE